MHPKRVFSSAVYVSKSINKDTYHYQPINLNRWVINTLPVTFLQINASRRHILYSKAHIFVVCSEKEEEKPRSQAN